MSSVLCAALMDTELYLHIFATMKRLPYFRCMECWDQIKILVHIMEVYSINLESSFSGLYYVPCPNFVNQSLTHKNPCWQAIFRVWRVLPEPSVFLTLP